LTRYKDLVPQDIQDSYEVHDFQHACAILYQDFRDDFNEIMGALRAFRFKEEWVTRAGGNESQFPKAFSEILRPLGWREAELEAKLVVTEKVRKGNAEVERTTTTERTLEDDAVTYGTHNIDYVKGRIALDFEWNSKDQTFDRDLNAFRAFHEYRKIDVGILVTRSSNLEDYFRELGSYVSADGKERTYREKYGASTTHMGKLLPRVRAGRNGGCPLLVFGITRALLEE
jgi:hypothetical protein